MGRSWYNGSKTDESRDESMTLYCRLCGRLMKNRAGDADRARWGTLGAATGIAANLLLSAVKIAVGLLTGSVAATADGANNLSDAGGSLVSLAAVRLARKRETSRNPFGFGRMEYLGALGVGILIAVMGVELLISGVKGILNPAEVGFSWLSLGLLGASVLVKVWLYAVYRDIGGRTKNMALLAAAKDSLSDCAATGAVMLSMLAANFLHVAIDGYAGVLVSLFVLRAGYGVLRDTVSSLLGGKPDKELGDQIISRVLSYPYVQGVHDFVMHDYGPGRCMASIHAEVPADGDLVAMHEVIDRMERDIEQALHVPLCVHIDPVCALSKSAAAARDALSAFLAQYDPPVRMHDFRVVPGEEQINLIFDAVPPPGFAHEDKLLADIAAKAKTLDARYACVVHVDKDYYHD